MIPLMRNTFINEAETKQMLSDFILKTEKLSMGEKCFEFEKVFAEKQQASNGVLFNSGGSANLAILQALKNLGRLKDGDKVGFSALTWATNTMPIIQMGMVPVPIDCSLSTLNVMSDNLIDRLEQVELKALFLTNVLGFLGDIDKIKNICAEKNIILIEDNCESLGTVLKGQKSGNFGVAASFSFFVAHHMSTIEGGMVCTSDEELAEMLRITRANGWDRNLSDDQKSKWREKYGIDSQFLANYTFYDLAFNFRPTEITGFLGLTQIQYLDENIKIREGNYLKLEKIIHANDDFINLDHSQIDVLSTFAIPLICKSPELRKKYIQKFNDAGVEIRPMIAGNMQRQPFYSKYVEEQFELPNTDFIHDNGLYCGNYPELTSTELDIIASCLKSEN